MFFHVVLHKKKIVSLTILLITVLLCSFSLYAQSPQNPFIHNHSVYVSKQGVYKFDITTLKLQWQALTNIQTFEPVVFKGLLYIGSSQGLYALDMETGEEIWRLGADYSIFSPAVVNQHLYAGSRHGVLYDISPYDGAINWQRKVEGWVYSPAIVKNHDELVLWTGGQAHKALAIAASTGDIIHRIHLSQEVVFSPVVIQEDVVGFNLFDGFTLIIETGKENLTNVIAGSSQAKTIRAENGLIYRASRDGTLTAFDISLKKIQWEKKIFDIDLTMHPSLEGNLLLSNQDQWLLLFDTQRQKVIWHHKMAGNWFAPIQLNHNEIMVFYYVGVNFDSIKAVIVNTSNQQAG